MKQYKYISIGVRLACLSHKRKKTVLTGVNGLLKTAPAAETAKERA